MVTQFDNPMDYDDFVTERVSRKNTGNYFVEEEEGGIEDGY